MRDKKQEGGSENGEIILRDRFYYHWDYRFGGIRIGGYCSWCGAVPGIGHFAVDFRYEVLEGQSRRVESCDKNDSFFEKDRCEKAL
ncbi:hypothetical protein JW948_07805 [bacterium]|nr:hypothetical protein [bacterium]